MNPATFLPVTIELLVKSALISLAAALLARGWREATAAQRHLVWLVALATVMLLPLTRLVAPQWAIPLQPAKKVAITLPALPPVSVTSLDVATFRDTTIARPAVRTLPDWRIILLGAWLSGTIFLLGYRLFGSWRLHRLLRRSVPLDDPRVRLLLSRVLSELGLPRRPEIRLSEECRVPITWGSLRPVMLLPAAALAWNDTWLLAALRHEAAHIRRYDYLTRWFAHVACAVYWPNPLVWLLARSLRVAQELAADDLVLRAGTPPEEYATQLVDAARTVATHGLFIRQAVAMACPSTLEDRVRAIVDGRRDRRPLSRLAAAFGSLAIALALAISTAAQLRSAGDEPPAPPPPLPKASEAAPAKPHEAHVEIFTHIVEMAPEVKTTPPMPGKLTIWSDPQFQVIWRAMNQTKGMDLLTAPKVTTRSNQQATVEIVREFRHPNQWEKDASGWQPKEFATKNVGTTLEVTPLIKEDGVIELPARVKIAEFMGFQDLENGKPAPANPDLAHHRYKPIFSERKWEGTVTLKDGETVMFPDLPETADVKPFEKESAHRRQTLVFITAQIVPRAPAKESPKEGAAATTLAAAEASAEPPGKPPQGLVTKEWKVPPDMIPPKPVTDGPIRVAAKNWLISKGVTFDGAATAIYVADTSRLIVRNTQAQLDLIDQVVSDAAGAQDPARAGAINMDEGTDLDFVRRVYLDLTGQPPTPDEARAFLADPRPSREKRKGLVDKLVGKSKTGTINKGPMPPDKAAADTGTLTIRGGTLTLGGTVTVNAGTKPAAAADSPARAKAEKIIIPDFELREATLVDALDSLRKQAVEFDPDKTGVKIVLQPGTVSDARITMSLKTIPVIEALHYVTGLANLEFVVTPEALVVQPVGTGKVSLEPAPQGTGQLTLTGGTLTFGANTTTDAAVDSPALAKARTLIIPKIELPNATIADALDFLRLKAKEIDPDKTGVNIVRKPGAVSDARISLSLTDIPLFDAVRYVAGLANLELVTEPNALTIQPPGGGVLLQAKLATPAATTDRVAITLSPKKAFQGGDGIEIREVTGSASTFQVGGTYRVRGVCRQATIRNAALYLGITAEGSGEAIRPAAGTSLSRTVAKGATEFDFTFIPLRPGRVHVTLYDLDNYDPKDNANAGLYLGDVSP